MKRIFVLLALLICLTVTGCSSEGAFEGSRILDGSGFTMEYSLLDREERASVELAVGDSLRVSVAQESGKVDVTVDVEGAEPVYEGRKLTNAEFTLNIPESGTYRISVTGYDASGSVSFLKDEAASSQDRQAMLGAYQFALQQIAFEHVYPDGRDTGFNSDFGFIEDNSFALADVNGDGAEELIVRIETAPMVDMRETVYAFDGEKNTVREILSAFPGASYYDNGAAIAIWSHGSALAGDGYWPFYMHRYNEATGKYELLASVDMWSSSVETVNYEGESYPYSIDQEGAGTVFMITQGDTTETVSMSDYEAWLGDIIGTAQIVEPQYMALSEENISSVCK